MSEIWQYFDRDGERASCKLCAKTLSCKGSTTSALINHIKNVHKLKMSTKTKKTEESLDEPTAKKTQIDRQITNYFTTSETAHSILARCAAEDGMSVRAIQRSKLVNSYMRSKGYKIPSSRTTIWKQIYQFYKEKVEELSKHLSTLKRENGRFSITVDEWSDISNIKYINVSLRAYNANTKMHEVYNLGLEEITRKATAENIQYYVQKKLSKFLLDLDQDIVASTHDGAAVMKKYGQEISAYSQLCFNHAIHLCVVECFYTDRRKSHLEESDEESENSDYESDFDCEDLFESEGSSIESERNSEILERKKKIYIEEILRKVRKCVNTFAKSNEKQKKLQEYIQKEEGKEVRLSLDVKHRWNSMAKMVAQFLKVYKCVNHALLDMGLDTFSEAEINSLEELNNLLKPLELAVIEFSKDSATLIEAEGIFKFLVNKLKKINSQHTAHLYECLKSRFAERRSAEMTSLIIYLSSGNFPVQSYDFTYCSKTSTKHYGERIYNRLFEEVENSIYDDSLDTSLESISSSSLTEELNQTIKSVRKL